MKTLLLIEDSKFLRMATERLLVKEGYVILCANDGEQALSIARERRPDMVILDMLLPKISGIELLNKLKSGSLTSGIPVIVLSGMSQRNEEKLKRAGASAFLEKGPLLENPKPLLEAIETILAQTPPWLPTTIEETPLAINAKDAGQ